MPTQIKAVITGHSRGLGAALARRLLEDGAEVFGLSRRGNPDLSGMPGLRDAVLDLSDIQTLSDWIASGALSSFLEGDGPRLLINNAGMVDPIGKAGTLDPAAIGRAVSLNVAAPMMLADAFISATDHVADRRIMHISSGAGRNATSGWSSYCATKAALDMHAKALVEDGLTGLRIESLAPGVVDTDMQATIRAAPEERFASVKRFLALKKDGDLSDPAVCAAAIIRHLGSDRFGDEILTDIRRI